MTNRLSRKFCWSGPAFLLLLNACATDPNSCDPRQGGFIAGLSAMGSGCYEQRVAMKQEKASTAKTLTDQLNSENQSLKYEKSLTSAQKRRAQQKLATLQNRNADLERKIQGMRANSPSSQSEKARLQKQLQQAKTDAARLKQQIQAGTITEKELNQEAARLTKEREQMADDISRATLIQ